MLSARNTLREAHEIDFKTWCETTVKCARLAFKYVLYPALIIERDKNEHYRATVWNVAYTDAFGKGVYVCPTSVRVRGIPRTEVHCGLRGTPHLYDPKEWC